MSKHCIFRAIADPHGLGRGPVNAKASMRSQGQYCTPLVPRCWRCGKIGPDCVVYTTEEVDQRTGETLRMTHYCGID